MVVRLKYFIVRLGRAKVILLNVYEIAFAMQKNPP